MDPIKKIFNGNVYEDGTKSYVGKVKEIEMPKLVHLYEDHEALGLITKLQLPTGTVDALSTKFIWSSFDADAWVKSANPLAARKLQIRSSVQAHGPQGQTGQEGLTTLLTVQSKQADLGKLTKGAGSEFEEEFVVSYIKQSLGSRVLIEFDAFALIWTVDGKDIIADWKKNLGL